MLRKPEIEEARKRLLSATKQLAADYAFTLRITQATPEQLLWMALGSIAMSSFVLQRDSKSNYDTLIDAIEGINRTRNVVSEVARDHAGRMKWNESNSFE